MKYIVLFLFSLNAWSVDLNLSERIDRFAFGSCNKQDKVQPLWGEILSSKPQLWIWGGDIVYPPNNATPAELKAAYDKQQKNLGYQALKAKVPVIGVWDDHDYGLNNGGANYQYKNEARQIFLDFIGAPANDPRRSRPGIYHSYTVGPVDQQVKILLIDNRTFKIDGNILGEAQWTWLERELEKSKAQVHFLVFGLSVLAPRLVRTEDWRDDMTSYNRMMELLRKHQPKGIIILSGDKHFSHFFHKEGLLEFMSSGLTHTVRLPLRPVVNRYYSNPHIGLNFGVVDIHWDETPLKVTLSMRGQHGRIPQRQTYVVGE